MSDEMPKFRVRRVPPRSATEAPADAEPASSDVRSAPDGRVQFDERGNAKWDWSQQTSRMGRSSSSEPMRVLDNPTLSLAEDAPTPCDVVRPNPLGTVKGYNPYDSGKLDRKRKRPAVKKDLRKLSEWIKLRKQVAGNDPTED